MIPISRPPACRRAAELAAFLLVFQRQAGRVALLVCQLRAVAAARLAQRRAARDSRPRAMPAATQRRCASSWTLRSSALAAASGSLRISGGAPPYLLRIIENSADISLEVSPGTDPDGASLLHVLGSQTTGQLVLEVEDSTGKVAQSEPLIARARPSVATLELPAACAGLSTAASVRRWCSSSPLTSCRRHVWAMPTSRR